VNLDCTTRPPCTGYDFYTQMYRGYLTVPTTGSYTFYIEGTNDKGLWLSTDSDISNAQPIIADSDSRTPVGSDVGSNQWRSAARTLTAGVVYALYATHYVVHNHPSGMLWEGPGIAKQYIQGQYLMPTYQQPKPGAPTQLQVVARGTDFLRVSWSPDSGSAPPAAYHVYVDGAEQAAVTDTVATVASLSPNTTYSVFVIAEDMAGELSFPSNVVTATTYGTDGVYVIVHTGGVADTLDFIGSGGALDGSGGVLNIASSWVKWERLIEDAMPGDTLTLEFGFISDDVDVAEGMYIDDIGFTCRTPVLTGVPDSPGPFAARGLSVFPNPASKAATMA